MRRAAFLAPALLATLAAPAHAQPQGDCRVVLAYSTAPESGTLPHDHYAYVVASATGSGTVTVTCYISVNGVFADGTPTATGDGAAAVEDRLTYRATDVAELRLCVRYTDATSAGWDMSCYSIAPALLHLPPIA